MSRDRLDLILWDENVQNISGLNKSLGDLISSKSGPIRLVLRNGSLLDAWIAETEEEEEAAPTPLQVSRVPPEQTFPPEAGGSSAVVVPVSYLGLTRRFKELIENVRSILLWRSRKPAAVPSQQELESRVWRGIDRVLEDHGDANGLGRKFLWIGSGFALRVSFDPDLFLFFVVTHDHDAKAGDPIGEAARSGIKATVRVLKDVPVRFRRLYLPPIAVDPWCCLPLEHFAKQFRQALHDERAFLCANYGRVAPTRWVYAPRPVDPRE